MWSTRNWFGVFSIVNCFDSIILELVRRAGQAYGKQAPDSKSGTMFNIVQDLKYGTWHLTVYTTQTVG